MPRCNIKADSGAFAITAPYDPGFVQELKSQIQPGERRFRGEDKAWLVSTRHGKTLQDLCMKYYNEQDALDVAKTYKNRIDTIYVGPENGGGQAFLQQLAKASGGQGVTSAQVKELASDIKTLLLA